MSRLQLPQTRFGVMTPGERRTLPVGAIPAGCVPFLQPGSACRVAEYDQSSVTLENPSAKASPFVVTFITQKRFQQIMAVSNAVKAFQKEPK